MTAPPPAAPQTRPDREYGSAVQAGTGIVAGVSGLATAGKAGALAVTAKHAVVIGPKAVALAGAKFLAVVSGMIGVAAAAGAGTATWVEHQSKKFARDDKALSDYIMASRYFGLTLEYQQKAKEAEAKLKQLLVGQSGSE